MYPRISIIIVNYNTRDLLFNCLTSIKESISIDYEVLVIDNNSTDDSFAKCSVFGDDERFKLIFSNENSGFAKGNNKAVGYASGEIFHFLNPDTEVDKSLNDDYIEVINNPDAVFINPLINSDGSLDNRMMPIPSLKNIFYWDFNRKKAQYWFKGASIIISESNFKKIGGWCEDYFMYAEDLDLFYRIWSNAIPIKMLKSKILHHGYGSSKNEWTDLEREIMVQKSKRIFYKKFYSRLEYVSVEIYFIFHKLLRHPSQLPIEIKSLFLSK